MDSGSLSGSAGWALWAKAGVAPRTRIAGNTAAIFMPLKSLFISRYASIPEIFRNAVAKMSSEKNALLFVNKKKQKNFIYCGL
jgi:hypothetical protein